MWDTPNLILEIRDISDRLCLSGLIFFILVKSHIGATLLYCDACVNYAIFSVSLIPNSSLVAVSKSFTASAKELGLTPDAKHLSI